MENRLSHENKEIKELYTAFYGEPLSPLAEKMLHTAYLDRSEDFNPPQITKSRWKLTVLLPSYPPGRVFYVILLLYRKY